MKPSTDLEQLASAAYNARAKQNKRATQPTTSTKSSNATRFKDPLEMAGQYSDEDASHMKTTTGGKKKDKDAGEKKPRKPLPKLDEARWAGCNVLPDTVLC